MHVPCSSSRQVMSRYVPHGSATWGSCLVAILAGKAAWGSQEAPLVALAACLHQPCHEHGDNACCSIHAAAMPRPCYAWRSPDRGTGVATTGLSCGRQTTARPALPQGTHCCQSVIKASARGACGGASFAYGAKAHWPRLSKIWPGLRSSRMAARQAAAARPMLCSKLLGVSGSARGGKAGGTVMVAKVIMFWVLPAWNANSRRLHLYSLSAGVQAFEGVPAGRWHMAPI